MQIRAMSDDTALLDEFVDLPWRVYAGDERWIPPLKGRVRQLLSPEENPFFRHGSMKCFLAMDGGRAVGRIAAIVDDGLRHQDAPLGLVGFFESVEDEGAAAGLFDAALDWLADRGIDAVWGPVQFSIWHSYRLMTRGFDREPFVGEPYNPSYYPALFEKAGFSPLARWYSWDLERAHLQGMYEFAGRFRNQELIDAGYRRVPFDLEDFDRQLETLYELLREGFSQNAGYAPIDLEEFRFIYEAMRRLILPEMVPFIVDPSGEPIGFAYTYPDYAGVFRAANGDAERFAGAMQSLEGLGTDRAVYHTMAIRQALRGKGLVETFLVEPTAAFILDQPFERGIGALAKEGATIYDKTGPATREYALYGR